MSTSRDRTSELHRAATSSSVGRRLHEIAVEGEVLTAARRAARGHTVLAILDQNGALLLETPHEIASRFAG